MKTNVNQQLFQLYASKWSNLSKAFNPIIKDGNVSSIPTSPLFLCVDEENYEKADLKIMFFGQETNGWIEKDCYYAGTDESLKYLMDGYYDFLYNGRCWKHGGQFWNGVKMLQKMMAEKFPNKNLHFIWNNIIKIGKAEGIGRPPKHIYDIERSHFSVIQAEIDVLKPDLIVFFTGPYYDNAITDNFGLAEYTALQPFSKRQLAKVEIPNIKNAVRTYHPNFLWRNDIGKYFSAIINSF
jgi:hypothetical protein